MNLREYFASLKGKRVAVMGIGVSNLPLIRLLRGAGVDVTACDGNEQAPTEEPIALGAQVRVGADYLSDLNFDVIFRTPGMHPSRLDGAPAGCVITSEMELFFAVCPCRIIGVTGSDGKTTTTTIIASLLREAGYAVHLGGNIGTPLLDRVAEMRPGDYAVLELSSFQLMTLRQSPDIAVVTNLAPNHLDVHLSMDEYIEAKTNLFRYQTEWGRVVLNADCALTRGLAPLAAGQMTYFSRRQFSAEGVGLRDGAIHCGGRAVLPVSDILLPGAHNIENFMAAIAAVDGLVPDEVIRRVAEQFTGVEHRIELVRTLGGVRFYNDSIASSPSRTIAGLRAFEQKVILIAGGRDKKVPFDGLGAEVVERVKLLVVTGEAAGQIRRAVEAAPGYEPGRPKLLEVPDFTAAVLAAARSAEDGDIVLLSPACTSFDCFKNFAERGAFFKKIIHDL